MYKRENILDSALCTKERIFWTLYCCMYKSKSENILDSGLCTNARIFWTLDYVQKREFSGLSTMHKSENILDSVLCIKARIFWTL